MKQEEIIILDKPPTILTKNRDWAKDMARRSLRKEGEIIVLPEDAILVVSPIYETKTNKTNFK